MVATYSSSCGGQKSRRSGAQVIAAMLKANKSALGAVLAHAIINEICSARKQQRRRRPRRRHGRR